MATITRSYIAIALAALIVTTSDAAAKAIEERNWILMESKNFAIHSALTAKKTEDMLRRLEATRALFVPASQSASVSELVHRRLR